MELFFLLLGLPLLAGLNLNSDNDSQDTDADPDGADDPEVMSTAFAANGTGGNLGGHNRLFGTDGAD